MEQTLKEQAEEYLQEIGVKFQTIDDRRFKVGYVGLNLKLIEVLVRFSEDDANDFIMTSYSVGCSFSGDLYHEGLELCNELNNEFVAYLHVRKLGSLNFQGVAPIYGMCAIPYVSCSCDDSCCHKAHE